ncbi:MAG TPA: AmmeMemoRadiSam system protein B [bacterium]|nr:AmmeMemoRadiSam system protein B [bacterium]
MNASDLLPALRYIEVVPVETEAGQHFLLRDPKQLSDRMLTVSQAILFCLQAFDGATQAETLRLMWREASRGQDLPLEHLAELVEQLDELYLLVNDRALARLNELRQEFLEMPVRPMRLAAPADELQQVLDACYIQAGLPLPGDIAAVDNRLGVLIAPHIDYMRGGPAYGLAYLQMKKHFSGEVVLVLGTNHQEHQTALALTKKDYLTPWGEVTTDVALVERLAAALPFDVFTDEFCHRDEHSVELAACALKHAFGDACPKIVPVLCGSFEEFLQRGLDPLQDETLQAVRRALTDLATAEGERLAIVASADLAHIGLQFGDGKPVDQAVLDACLERDRLLLAAMTAGDADEFLDRLRAERNARHVCGVAPIHYALAARVTGAATEASLNYWRAEDESGAVTFAAAALLRP